MQWYGEYSTGRCGGGICLRPSYLRRCGPAITSGVIAAWPDGQYRDPRTARRRVGADEPRRERTMEAYDAVVERWLAVLIGFLDRAPAGAVAG
jgi:hypothetical protein